VSDIILKPVALNRYSMTDPVGGCEYGMSDAVLDIALTTGRQGFETLSTLEEGGVKLVALPSIGEAALVWGLHPSNIPKYQEVDVVARKGDLICTVQLHFRDSPEGHKAVTSLRGQELATKVGALCAKLFAH
jgi:hypothetical protein